MNRSNSLRKASELGFSSDPRAAKADVTNARELFGDAFGDINNSMLGAFNVMSGDIDDGDIDDGDIDDGDIDDGDIDDGDSYGDNDSYGDSYGDPRRKKLMRALGLSAAAVGSALTTRKLIQMYKKKKALRAARQGKTSRMIAFQRGKQTLVNQRMVRENAGQIDRKKKLPFFSVTGAKMNNSPIDPLEGFIADMFKYMLDRQAAETPFQQDTAIGVFALGTWTATATGVVTNRLFHALILQLGINQLNAAPGTVFNVTATIPTIAGVLTVAAQPWLFTIEKSFDVRFMFFPWQLVQNRPLPVLGQYSNAAPIIVNVTGLPAASTVNLIVPGSLHPWTVGMRNALMR